MKIIFISFILLTCCLSSYCNNDSLDLSINDNQYVYKKLLQLEKDNAVLINQLEEINIRFNDLYMNLRIWTPSIIFLIIALLGASWFNARGLARRIAEKELERIQNRLDEISMNAQDTENLVNSLRRAVLSALDDIEGGSEDE